MVDESDPIVPGGTDETLSDIDDTVEELKAEQHLQLLNEYMRKIQTTNGSNRYDEVEALLNSHYSENYDNYIDGSIRLVYPMWTENSFYYNPTLLQIANNMTLLAGLSIGAEVIGGYNGKEQVIYEYKIYFIHIYVINSIPICQRC